MNKTKSNHIPMRSCAACHRVQPKTELIRVVLVGTAMIKYDPTQKLQGRGAYVCKSTDCKSNMIQKNGFDRAFRRPIDKQSINQLIEEWDHE